MNKPLYVCYSQPLRDFLIKNGLRYEIGGKHMTTDKHFWVFMRNEKLNKLLNEWTSNSKN